MSRPDRVPAHRPPGNPDAIPGFPWRWLVHAPIAAASFAAALWLALDLGIGADLVSNWLAAPCLTLLALVGMAQLVAVPVGIWRATRAHAWHRPAVWLALLCGIGSALLAAGLAVTAIYASA